MAWMMFYMLVWRRLKDEGAPTKLVVRLFAFFKYFMRFYAIFKIICLALNE
jgi:hypothetical protein